MDELNKYYQVLGLSPGASLEEVNQAYKDLAFIWHPDRIPTDNPRLQQKAQDKLKEINHARDQLRLIGKNPPTPKAQPRPSSQP
ncbi:MAG: J domain-containing protein, partial [Crinalium sp.]